MVWYWRGKKNTAEDLERPYSENGSKELFRALQASVAVCGQGWTWKFHVMDNPYQCSKFNECNLTSKWLIAGNLSAHAMNMKPTCIAVHIKLSPQSANNKKTEIVVIHVM